MGASRGTRRVHVVGSGPNGLAAALVLQEAGFQVCVSERMARPGGGLLSGPGSTAGHLHDSCAAILPLALASPFLRSLDLAVPWIQPPASLAHPLDDGTALLLWPGLQATAAQLGGPDAGAYQRLLRPLIETWDVLAADVLAPPHRPRAAAPYARFALLAGRSAAALARARFRSERARTLFAGLAAHGTLPLERPPSAAFALVLAACAHTAGWPLVRGGSERLAEALAARFRRAGGEIRTGVAVRALRELSDADAVVLDVGPRGVLRLAGAELSPRWAARLQRFRYGCGVHKVDWTLAEPVPWRAAECGSAGTVHLGGSTAEIARALRAACRGEVPQPPFVLFGQPTQFDRTRAPAGQHQAWAYCAVPLHSRHDFTPAIEAQVERFAPGFRELIRTRDARTAAQLEEHNPNLVGGSLAGAVHSLRDFFLGPFGGRSPYRTPLRGVYLCSAVTPPGPGVHGMCGYHAARTVRHDLRVAGHHDLYPRHRSSIL